MAALKGQIRATIAPNPRKASLPRPPGGISREERPITTNQAAAAAVAHALDVTDFFEVARAQLNEFAECEVDYETAVRLLTDALHQAEID